MIALTSCASPRTPAGLPNLASVYCKEDGSKLEIVTATDASQIGRCVFPNGSVCDEWAYYPGECGPAVIESTTNASGGTPEQIVDWWGVIKSTDPGSQFDDYFERQDPGQIIYFGIDSMDPAVKSQIDALRDSGKIVHLYGTLVGNAPDYNGSQILVERIEVEE